MPPRSIEELLYRRLLQSPAFHRFVRGIYYRVNGINPESMNHSLNYTRTDSNFKPTALHKFKAWRLLFYDEMRSSLGFTKKYNF